VEQLCHLGPMTFEFEVVFSNSPHTRGQFRVSYLKSRFRTALPRSPHKIAMGPLSTAVPRRQIGIPVGLSVGLLRPSAAP